jgi:hypothetical protein
VENYYCEPTEATIQVYDYEDGGIETLVEGATVETALVIGPKWSIPPGKEEAIFMGYNLYAVDHRNSPEDDHYLAHLLETYETEDEAKISALIVTDKIREGQPFIVV